tara:strand:+ start:261 stop:737 length:477 start_codon:yes stop_codon:yes gene_type:complete
MSDSFINASNIRSFDTTKKYNEPSIVIWNNGGSKVAFVGNDNEAKTYLYNDECFTKIINNNHITERIYDAGPHSKICDTLKNGKAIYIEKIRNKWCKLGYIIDSIKINNSNNYKFYIYYDFKILATNKRDALTILGYQKQTGKGTGNLMWGFCKIEKM